MATGFKDTPKFEELRMLVQRSNITVITKPFPESSKNVETKKKKKQKKKKKKNHLKRVKLPGSIRYRSELYM